MIDEKSTVSYIHFNTKQSIATKRSHQWVREGRGGGVIHIFMFTIRNHNRFQNILIMRKTYI